MPVRLALARARAEIRRDDRRAIVFSLVKPTNCLEEHSVAAERLYTGYQWKRLTG